jgi:purine-binding chemotaxis protein CheW
VKPGESPALPGTEDGNAEGARQYLAFALAERSYAVPLVQIAEISPNRTLNHMPHMPKGVEGLLDLRGTMVPVLNLRCRLGLPPLDAEASENILVVQLGGQPLGLLVDRVQSVVTAAPEAHVPASPLLAGKEGALVTGFLVLPERVVVLLDLDAVATLGSGRSMQERGHDLDQERRLEEGLRALIALAPEKDETGRARLIPQLETTISHTEEEVSKIVSRAEAMLDAADQAFRSLATLKQEARLGRLKGQEALLAEMEKGAQEIQDRVFELIQQLQFQDIARQKLERVLVHMRGLQVVMGTKLRDAGRA